ncbi:MAG: hypothetical protein RLZZ341_2637 [Pseudomonadota bacterium]
MRAARPSISPTRAASAGELFWLTGLVLTVLVLCATSTTSAVRSARRQVALPLSSW